MFCTSGIAQKSTAGWQSFETPDSFEARAYYIPGPEDSNDWIILFHDWHGVTEHFIEDAEAWQREFRDFHLIIPDLYDGRSTKQATQAAKLQQELDPERARQIIHGLRVHLGFRSHVSTIGWSTGGSWALEAAVIFRQQALSSITYYGLPNAHQFNFEKLAAKVMGILSEGDEYLTDQDISSFVEGMREGGKELELLHFNTSHSFATSGHPLFDRHAERQARKIVSDFVKDCHALSY